MAIVTERQRRTDAFYRCFSVRCLLVENCARSMRRHVVRKSQVSRTRGFSAPAQKESRSGRGAMRPNRECSTAVRPASVLRLALIGAALLVGWFASSVDAADFREAEALFKAGEYNECLEQTEDGVKESYRAEDWWLLRLECQMTLGDYPAALESYKSGVAKATESIRLRWAARDVLRFNGQPQKAADLFNEIGNRIRAQAWRYRVSGLDLVIVGRFLLESGLDPKAVLDGAFSSAKRTSSGRIAALIASGELALSKEDFGLAAEYFGEALQLDAANPEIHFGIAEAFGPSDSEKSQAAIQSALELNADHIPSLLFIASRHIDREAYEEAETLLDRVLSINELHPAAWAYRAVIAHVENDEEAESAAIEKALATWTTNPQVPYLVGKKLSQKYRFAEAAVYQKMALAFDAEYLPAKVQLSQDLLRLGDEGKGWDLAASVSEADPYNVMAYNLATLRDHLNRYTILESGRFRVRMDPQEASLYGPRVLNLLSRAEAYLAERYEAELPPTVYVDIYPNQADFAIRTFGLPGGAGFLGVCFGPVVTMNSPAAQGSAQTSWESVLWHEFTHVITLTKTKNRMPRWLSEGISVYEERLADARWGQSMNPAFRQMILGDDLTPVSELSGAFLSPASPMHLQFAYYESSLVVEYLVEEFGIDAVRNVLSDLGDGITINDALSRHTIDIDDLDTAFAKHVRDLANSYASEADFAELDLPPGVDRETIDAVLAARPTCVAALQRLVQIQLAERDAAGALATLNRAIELFGDAGSPVDLLQTKAEIQKRVGDESGRLNTLRAIVSATADDVDALRELMERSEEQGDLAKASELADQLLAVDPLLAAPHHVVATAAERRGDTATAIASLQALQALQALSAMEPADPAGLNYRIAALCQQSKRWEEARRHVLLALEEAPRYRDAQSLLLTLADRREKIERAVDERPVEPAFAGSSEADNTVADENTAPDEETE